VIDEDQHILLYVSFWFETTSKKDMRNYQPAAARQKLALCCLYWLVVASMFLAKVLCMALQYVLSTQLHFLSKKEIIHNSKSVPIHGYQHAACSSVIKLLLQETYDLAIVPSSSSSYRKTNAFHHQKKSK